MQHPSYITCDICKLRCDKSSGLVIESAESITNYNDICQRCRTKVEEFINTIIKT